MRGQIKWARMIAATSSADHLELPEQGEPAGRLESTHLPARWQLALSRAITDPAELLHELQLDPQLLEPARRAAAKFGLQVPRGFVARITKGNPDDPLLRQVLPLGAELDEVPGYISDPVGDLASIKGMGLLHKYHGRALLIATGACAIHCRYCFRREFPYSDHLAAVANWQPVLGALTADRSIHEVILSGGDPLILADHKLRALTDGLAQITHIRRLRIHTRLPVVLPERVDAGLKTWLGSLAQPAALRTPLRAHPATSLKTIVVIHANHANEIDTQVEAALAQLLDCKVILLNQSVLLKGVNDSAETLIELSEKLFRAGVLPYYLHLLDPVRGTAHFRVDAERAAALMRAVAARLPGYLVPRLVREPAGAPYKQPLPW
jgi:EF-P beta-lysylation protein EpmB